MIELAAIFAAALLAGIAGMPPSISFGDCGEFAAASRTLAIAHPPGYPLYLLCTKAFGSFFVLGSWAYRTNLFSVACSAAALAVLADGAKRLGLRPAARATAVIVLLVSPVWHYETSVSEVFGLHALLCAALLWTLCAFSGKPWRSRPAAAAGLLFGLALANHQTALLAAPAFLLAFLFPSENRLRPTALFALFLLIGLSCYFYLPLRSAALPPLDWGHPTSVSRFLSVVTRRDYGSLSLTVGKKPRELERVWQAARYARFSASELGLPALALAALGTLCWPGLGLALPLGAALVLWFCAGPGFLMLGNPGFDALTAGALDRFYLASWLVLALFAGAGVERLSRAAPRARWLFAALPLVFLGISPRAWSAREDFAAYDYGRDLLRSIPPGARFFMDGGDDTFFALAYLSYGEGRRGDVELHDRGGLVFRSPYGEDFRALSVQAKEERRQATERALASQGNLYYSTLADRLIAGYRLEPQGLVRRASPESAAPFAPDVMWNFYAPRWSESLLRDHYRDRALVAVYPYMRAQSLIARGAADRAVVPLRQAYALAPDGIWVKPDVSLTLVRLGYEAALRGDLSLAESAYAAARPLVPGPDAEMGLGVVYHKTGRLAEAETAFLAAAKISPNFPQAYFNLGSLYWNQKRWREAADAFSRAASLSPGDKTAAGYAAAARAQQERAR